MPKLKVLKLPIAFSKRYIGIRLKDHEEVEPVLNRDGMYRFGERFWIESNGKAMLIPSKIFIKAME